MDKAVRHQFEMLDGLRGVAAFSVVIFHQRAWLNGGDWLLGHAYLSVDFFFMLSGFVLAHAYGEKLSSPNSFWRFLRDRVIRLHPALFLSAILSFVVALALAHRENNIFPQNWPLTLFASFIPFPALWTNSSEAFPWNLAIWSLFWEVIANIIYALTKPWLTTRVLIAIVVTSGIGMIASSQIYNGFQTGFTNDPVALALGLPRVSLSYFTGVLLYKTYCNSPNTPSSPRGEWIAVLILLLLAAVPLGSSASKLYDPFVVIVIFPFLLLAGARSHPSIGRWAGWSGALSYPLYVIHLPVLTLLNGLVVRSGASNRAEIAIGGIIALIATVLVAYAMLRWIDEPLRGWIRAQFRPH